MAYVRDVLKRFKDHLPEAANPSELPADPKTRLYAGGAKLVRCFNTEATGEHNLEEGSKDCEATVPYRELLGALLWISQGTRPDVTYAVSQCAKFSSKPKNAHWWALKKILRYLKGTADYGIHYKSPGRRTSLSLQDISLPEAYLSSVSAKESAGVTIDANVDADYANSMDDRRSVTGFVNFMAEGPITWQSKTQASVALSTMEAEYMALAAETQEAIWLRMVLEELGVPIAGPIAIREDNKACQMFAITQVTLVVLSILMYDTILFVSAWSVEKFVWIMCAQTSKWRTSSPRPYHVIYSRSFVQGWWFQDRHFNFNPSRI
jgi:hypothetical protein